MLLHLGSEVDIVLRGTTLLREFDTIIQETLMSEYKLAGIKFHLEKEITRVEKDETSGKITLRLKSGEILQGYDCLLWAIGRSARIERLGLEKIALATNSRGFIDVDDFQTTNVPGIYALGDVCGHAMLTPGNNTSCIKVYFFFNLRH